ncbi:hypothetical protein SH580_20865 [Coraliomargarita algicola]|uniref:Peptidase A2 domain-containing protein n=1 Tax=Coraliomargarita algicola TaxID=3092156 RepID=A0ABZ0RM66_9BACT|nr:hypothetical protein [Coraliomargarita sp. J2-16]WPJ95870.1 hypothetical protein SH580_20865 [Coraliomargarita sp. J2-16]
MKLVNQIFNAALMSLLLVSSIANAASAVPYLSDSSLKLEVGDYSLEISKEAAWTINTLTYQGEEILMDTGAHQTVLKMKKKEGVPAKYEFIGTKHGGEIIESLTLEVDGVVYPFRQPLEAPAGDIYKFTKVSRYGPVRGTWTVILSEQGLEELADFEEVGDTSEVNYAYVYMHCWNPKMLTWSAILKDGGLEEGNFLGNVVEKGIRDDITGIALFSEKTGVGAVLAYPQVFPGVSNNKSFLKYRPSKYNKLYLMVNASRLVSESYSCKVKGFVADSTDEWKPMAMDLIAGAYPAME